MKVAIVGSRNYQYPNIVIAMLEELLKQYKDELILISGGASGPDTICEQFAIKNKCTFIKFPAQWDLYGKQAGFIRNKEIVENSDIIYAFYDGSSKGTLLTINLAKEMNKHLFIIEDGKRKCL